MSLKKIKSIYLLGNEIDTIKNYRKLPRNRQVLLLLFYKVNTLKLFFHHSLSSTIQEVQELWERTSLPFQRKDNCIVKLKKIYNKWILIRKNRSRKTSETQQMKELVFSTEMDELFDISYSKILLSQAQCVFLDSQRKPFKRGFIPNDVKGK